MKSRVLRFALLLLLIRVHAYGQTKVFQVDSGGTLVNGLQAYYEFENNFADFFNSNDLSQNQPAWVGFDQGKIGYGANSVKGGIAGGANFLFSDQNLNISGAGADFTFTCWAKMNQGPPANTAAENTILTHTDAVSGNHELLAVYYDGSDYYLGVSYHGAEFEAVFPFDAIDDGEFHFLALRHTGTVMEVWGDNVLLGSINGTGTGSGTTDQFTVFDVEPRMFIGIVDEVGVWNRALNSTEMSDLYNQGNGQTMIVSTTPLLPAVTLTPSYLVFPPAGGALRVTVANSGKGNLDIASTPKSIGSNASDFTVDSGTTCLGGATISPGDSCIMEVAFTPSTESWEVATLSLFDNANYGPQTVPLSGDGQLVSISPNPVPGSSSSQSITITGTDFVDGATINWQDLTTSPWTGMVTPQTVSPSTITASLNFTGESAIWQISVVNPGQAKTSQNRTSNFYTFQVFGSGAAAPSLLDDYPYRNAPVDALDPYEFAFDECTSYVAWRMNRDNGTTDPENPSFFKKMAGGNWGNAQNWGTNAAFLNYRLDPNSNPQVGDIAQWNNVGNNVGHVAYVERVSNPDGSIDVSEYNYGSDDGKIKYEYGVRKVPIDSFPDKFIHISRLSLNPTNLNFGSQFSGTSSYQTVEIKNLQTQTVSFPPSGVTVGTSEAGSGTASFTENDTCSGNSIPPGGQCEVMVTFTPPGTLTNGGPESAAIILNWGVGPQLIPVEGIALTSLDVSPEALAFGKISVGKTSVAKTVTLKNKTGADVTISSISTGSSEFGSNGCPATLIQGSSCTISVMFSPAAKGAQSASLTIIDSAVNSPQTIKLNGTGN